MDTLQYPAKIEPDGDGFLVTFPDFSDAVTYGDTKEEAYQNAVNSLREVIAARIAHREDIPEPSKHRSLISVILPPQTAAKALLYRTMREEGVNKSELARRLNWKLPQVDRLFKISHNSKLDQLEDAFSALNRKLVIGISD